MQLLFLIGTLLASWSHAAPSLAAGMPRPAQATVPSVQDVLWWLPEDTETLLVSNGPFPLTQSKPDVQPETVTDYSWFQWMFSGQLPANYYPQLGEGAIEFSVEGSRNFRSPAGFGMMPFDGCSVLVMRSGGTPVTDAVSNLLKVAGSKPIIVAGQKVVHFKKKMEHDQWNFYVTSPRPNVLLVATDRKYLTSVLYRMRYRRAKRALPGHLPAWKYVKTGAMYWGLRHVTAQQAQRDTEFFKDPKGRKWLGAGQSLSIVFNLDPRTDSKGRILFIASNPQRLTQSGVQRLTETWSTGSNKIRMKTPGIFEVEADFKNKDVWPEFIFYALGFLGHAIHL